MGTRSARFLSKMPERVNARAGFLSVDYRNKLIDICIGVCFAFVGHVLRFVQCKSSLTQLRINSAFWQLSFQPFYIGSADLIIR